MLRACRRISWRAAVGLFRERVRCSSARKVTPFRARIPLQRAPANQVRGAGLRPLCQEAPALFSLEISTLHARRSPGQFL